MTVITAVSRIRLPGVLRNFDWPADLHSFGRFNLVYGWNGSGKTTLSNIFRALELRKEPGGAVTLLAGESKIDASDFPGSTLPVRVFNRDFVSASVFPVGGGEVPPIFVLGEESSKKQAELEELKARQAVINQALQSANQEQRKSESALDRHCVARGGVVRDTLRSSGANPFNNYDKSRYKQRASEMASAGDRTEHVLDDEERDRLLSRSKAAPKEQIGQVQYEFPDLRKLYEKTDELLQRKVVSSVISSLERDPELSTWTRTGLALHSTRSADKCLFCEQRLPENRIERLEAHFSDAYERLLRELDEQIAENRAYLQSIDQLDLPNRAQLYDDLSGTYDEASTALGNATGAVGNFIGDLNEALSAKKLKVFEPVHLDVGVPDVSLSAVDELNLVIQRHNSACADFEAHVASARQRLEADLVAGSNEEYVALVDDAETSATRVGELSDEQRTLGQNISALEREIIEHRKPAEELNADLQNYLGHAELTLAVQDTGYVISRNGVPAQALSEGEMTAVALLYFLKTLGDRSFDKSNGLIVLDDPVSSLDANALFLAFGFIRSCVQDAGQVIILTHNFLMFRQVRGWFHHMQGQRRKDVSNRPARLYMLECSVSNDGRHSTLSKLDPLLEEYESEYHYLFASVYRRVHGPGAGGLEANYIFPNMARRLIETFLAFRRPKTAGKLEKTFESLSFDEARKQRILRFLHVHSHADAVSESQHDPSALGEAKAVLTAVLDLMRHEDSAHYDAMVDLVTPEATEQGEA